jgi:hypothetical protein
LDAATSLWVSILFGTPLYVVPTSKGNFKSKHFDKKAMD